MSGVGQGCSLLRSANTLIINLFLAYNFLPDSKITIPLFQAFTVFFTNSEFQRKPLDCISWCNSPCQKCPSLAEN